MPDPNSSTSMTNAGGSTPQQTGAGSNAGQSQHGGGIVNKVRETATAQLTTQKDRATDGIGSVAQMVRQSTQQLRDQKHDTIAGYVEQAASQLDKLSKNLHDKDVNELMSDVQRLARKQPAVFIGGAFALGLVGARFLKSSSHDQHDDQQRMYRGGTGENRGMDVGQYSGTATRQYAGSGAGQYGAANTQPAGSDPARAREYQSPGTGNARPYSEASGAGVTGEGAGASTSVPGSPGSSSGKARRGNPQNERS
jgi:hypothetical protein